MAFVATEDLELPCAKAERQGKKRAIVAELHDSGGWLTIDTLASRFEMNPTRLSGLCQELSGELLQQRTGLRNKLQWQTPDAWIVEGCSSTVVHTDPECEHLWTFECRPADGEAAGEPCEHCAPASKTAHIQAVDGGIRTEVADD